MGLLDRVKANQDGLAGIVAPEKPAAAPAPALPASPRGTQAAAAPTAPAPPASSNGRIDAGTRPAGSSLSRAMAGGADSAAPPRSRLSHIDSVSPAFTAAKKRVHAMLIERFANEIDPTNREFVREKIAELVEEDLRTSVVTMTRSDRDRLIESLLDDVLGLGPLENLLNDPEISEVMINHPKQVYVERRGVPTLSGVTFESNKQLMQIIDRVVSAVGRRVDESSPLCDARLKDGSRVNVVIPPLALKGPCMTIRKFSREKLGTDDLIAYRSATSEILGFLESCVRARMNILVSGGTGSGKTTLLNILSGFIPDEERIITCEDAAELQLQQEHVITLESRPSNVEGKGAVPIRELVRNCLRMRPDRIIVGECRGGEALDMLQAMNTGHDGSMSTLHANSPQEAMSRLETLVLMAGTDLPSRAIREQVASAVQLIVQQQRLRGGARRIVSVAEVTGLDEAGNIKLHEIFEFRQVTVSEGGTALGYHTATGLLPWRLDHLRASGEEIDESVFQPSPEPEELY
jgi:pilus assembly protein CpaF